MYLRPPCRPASAMVQSDAAQLELGGGGVAARRRNDIPSDESRADAVDTASDQPFWELAGDSNPACCLQDRRG